MKSKSLETMKYKQAMWHKLWYQYRIVIVTCCPFKRYLNILLNSFMIWLGFLSGSFLIKNIICIV